MAVKYDTRDYDHLFDQPSWAASASFEWSSPDISSDFDYTRYRFRLARYQPVNRYAMILARFAYGGSGGFLPMHKRFFLGGLGTLWGLRFKEQMGTEFWLGNIEYRFKIPRRAVALGVFWDGAQVATDGSKFSDAKHDLGIAAYIGGDVRFSLAKRLDRGFDDAVRFYVRFRHQF
ncbi:MAG: hypothetical protein D6800_14300 [Candidatus Zixiibacteriota bacterium]|nr:MAG: hypothetical protein D6800_14300 [candidate division Zixibacteria bacterium]